MDSTLALIKIGYKKRKTLKGDVRMRNNGSNLDLIFGFALSIVLITVISFTILAANAPEESLTAENFIRGVGEGLRSLLLLKFLFK